MPEQTSEATSRRKTPAVKFAVSKIEVSVEDDRNPLRPRRIKKCIGQIAEGPLAGLRIALGQVKGNKPVVEFCRHSVIEIDFYSTGDDEHGLVLQPIGRCEECREVVPVTVQPDVATSVMRIRVAPVMNDDAEIAYPESDRCCPTPTAVNQTAAAPKAAPTPDRAAAFTRGVTKVHHGMLAGRSFEWSIPFAPECSHSRIDVGVMMQDAPAPRTDVFFEPAVKCADCNRRGIVAAFTRDPESETQREVWLAGPRS